MTPADSGCIATESPSSEDASTLRAAAGLITIPLAREELVVSKRERESDRVAIHVRTIERDEIVDVPLTDETIEIEHVPMNRVVEAAAGTRQEGDVTIVPVYEEVLVVERRLMLKEEIRITRRRTQRQERREFKVRTEIVNIERPRTADADHTSPRD